MTPDQLLRAAEKVLNDAPRRVGAHRNVAACFLVRQALESAVDDLYRRARWPEMVDMNDRIQQITLPYVMDPATAADLVFAWNQLSTLCHHHAYEVAPPRSTVVALIEVARRLP